MEARARLTETELQKRVTTITQLRSEGYDNRSIGIKLGFSRDYVSRLANRRIDLSKSEIISQAPRPKMIQVNHRQRAAATGEIGEMQVAGELLLRGFDLWRSLLVGRADFAVSVNSRFVRIQVKTATLHPERNSFRTSFRLHFGHNQARAYETGDFEFFIVCCLGAEAYYVIPAPVGLSVKSKNVDFFPHRERVIKKNASWELYRNAFYLLEQDLCAN